MAHAWPNGGLKPFHHDINRGKWESPSDFFYACLGNAFKIDAVMVLPSMIFGDLGVFLIIPYFAIMALCVVPITFLQSFLGQFSNTGYITAFRIAPLFKGIGYVSLSLNLIQLCYYSVFAAIPLFYFLHALRPTIPWSCEGSKHWMNPNETSTTPCNIDDSVVKTNTFVLLRVPSLEFFSQHMNIIHYLKPQGPTTFSWSIVVFTFFVWIVVGSVLSKPTELIGKYIRHTCRAMLIMMGLILLRFLFLPGAFEGVWTFFRPGHLYNTKSWLFMGMLSLSTLGPGWGSTISMASYNKFKTNISKYSWLLSFAQFGVIMSIAFLHILVTNHLKSSNPKYITFRSDGKQWLEFLSVPTVLTFLEVPNLWSMMYFAMLMLGALHLVIVQLFSVLTTLFDEYENLRQMKREVTWMMVLALSLISLYFCTNHGIMFFEVLTEYSLMTQMLLNLLLLLVVLWIYGRVRLQRDLKFMTGRMYATWMVYIVRFITPMFLILGFGVGFLIAVVYDTNYSNTVFYVAIAMTVLPWLLFPGTCIHKLMKTKGGLRNRLKECVKPVDWYPMQLDDKQRYEESHVDSELSQHIISVQ